MNCSNKSVVLIPVFKGIVVCASCVFVFCSVVDLAVNSVAIVPDTYKLEVSTIKMYFGNFN